MRSEFFAIVLFALSVGSAFAQERELSGPEIKALLPTIIVKGEGTSQRFSAVGGTTYTDHGRDSTGSWTVEGDKYCSIWPPNQTKACYGVVVEDAPPDGGIAVLIWVDEAGARTHATFSAKE